MILNKSTKGLNEITMILNKPPFSHNQFQSIPRLKYIHNENFFEKAKNFCSTIDNQQLTNSNLPLSCKRYFAFMRLGYIRQNEIPEEIFLLTYNSLKNSNTKD